MKPMGAASDVQPKLAPQQETKPTTTGTKRMRQMVGYIAGGGFGLVLLICVAQLTLRPGIRPTDLMATIEAQTDIGVFNQKMGAAPGEMILTEAQYREELAEAERSGQAKAELEFQKELAVVQADKERVVGAYQTLYQRANMIAQAGLQLESMAQQMRSQLIQMSNGGRNMVIMFKDVFCGLGDPEACASAREDRGTMISEANELSQGDVGNRIKELMAGVEDPAVFITREDQRRNGTAALQHP